MTNQVNTCRAHLEGRHKNIFAAADRALTLRSDDDRLSGKLASMCGAAYPLPELSGANLPARALCQSLFDTESRRLVTFDPDDDVVVVMITNAAWDTSTHRPVIDVERCRKEGRLAIKRLLPSFLATQQVRILPNSRALDGGEIVESRILAIGSGPQLFDQVDGEAAICQRLFRARDAGNQPIKVHRLRNRRRDLFWAGTHWALCWHAAPTVAEADAKLEEAQDLRALRRLEIEAMLNLSEVTFGFDKGENLRRSILGCVAKQVAASAKAKRGPLHRDEIPHFIAELNVAIGKPEWLVPFAPNRK